jgi:hypothetical protein
LGERRVLEISELLFDLSHELQESEIFESFCGGIHQTGIRLSLNESDFEPVPPTRYPLLEATDLLSRKFRNKGTTQWNKEQ